MATPRGPPQPVCTHHGWGGLGEREGDRGSLLAASRGDASLPPGGVPRPRPALVAPFHPFPPVPPLPVHPPAKALNACCRSRRGQGEPRHLSSVGPLMVGGLLPPLRRRVPRWSSRARCGGGGHGPSYPPLRRGGAPHRHGERGRLRPPAPIDVAILPRPYEPPLLLTASLSVAADGELRSVTRG